MSEAFNGFVVDAEAKDLYLPDGRLNPVHSNINYLSPYINGTCGTLYITPWRPAGVGRSPDTDLAAVLEDPKVPPPTTTTTATTPAAIPDSRKTNLEFLQIRYPKWTDCQPAPCGA